MRESQLLTYDFYDGKFENLIDDGRCDIDTRKDDAVILTSRCNHYHKSLLMQIDQPLLHTSFTFLESEDMYQTILSSLICAFKELCAKHNIFVSGGEDSSFGGEGTVIFSKSIYHLMEEYLLPLLMNQCRILDQCVLLVCLMYFVFFLL